MEAKRGGVLLRLNGALQFVPASVALAVTAPPQITRVPGAPEMLLGAALHEGEVVPVIAIGAGRESMLVCSCQGEKVGFLGARIEATGLYDAAPGGLDGVLHAGELARTLDLTTIYARVQGEGWAGRWRG